MRGRQFLDFRIGGPRRGEISVEEELGQGLSVEAAVTSLRLAGIEYDSKTLRVIAEADGTVKIAVSALPR